MLAQIWESLLAIVRGHFGFDPRPVAELQQRRKRELAMESVAWEAVEAKGRAWPAAGRSTLSNALGRVPGDNLPFVARAASEVAWESFDKEPGARSRTKLADESCPVKFRLMAGNESWESDMSSGTGVVRAGRDLRLHHHRAPEVYLFLEGRGQMEIAGETFEVAPGKMNLVPGNAPHMMRAAPDQHVKWAFFFPYQSFDQVAYTAHTDPRTGEEIHHPKPMQPKEDPTSHPNRLEPAVSYDARKAPDGHAEVTTATVEDKDLGRSIFSIAELQPSEALDLPRGARARLLYVVTGTASLELAEDREAIEQSESGVFAFNRAAPAVLRNNGRENLNVVIVSDVDPINVH
jgi:mannose-6-phosphate isomerase-like protein (cupin superfamily)